MMGLDTPELPQHNECTSEKERGYEARDQLREIVAGARKITFCPDGLDCYGRTLAVVLAEAETWLRR